MQLVKELVYDNYWRMKADIPLRWGHLTAAKEIARGSTVLDVGCGNGVFLELLRESKDCHVTGVDVSELAIHLARQRGINAYVADVDGKPLPFRDNEFDYICAFDVLEHLYHPVKTLLEMRRVGNVLITICANPVWWRDRLKILTGRVPKGPAWRNGQHLYYWNYYDFLNLLKRCGWQPYAVFHRPGVPLIQRFSYKVAEKLANVRPNLFAYAYFVLCKRH